MDFSAFHPYVYYATRYSFYPGQSSAPRICYSSSIYLISEGYGLLRTGDRTYEAGPGALFYMPAGQPHEWVADQREPMVHICCYFDWNYVERKSVFDVATPICYQFDQLQTSFVGPLFPYAIPEMVIVDSLRVWIDLFQSFYKAIEYTNERTFMRSLTAQRNFQTFIDYFLTYMLQDSYVPDPRISHLLDQIEKDLLNGTIQPLAYYYESLHISRGHFFEIFKKSTGYSPVQYLNGLRISRAKEDLLHSSLSISKIAEKYHFSSVHYFSRLFHKQTGQSPRDFRAADPFE
ncbi:AraC family transcriptional regulator [Paenibacillus pectinilyticus]|uniref:AraC family transcriptional regulator n=1 Tax=Paenibacillus pectinilyticus TaxID=512399 RepID=A0A1C0ZXS4_9BACL|nr:AraC family transcriptional regulator [Paenibacillus pectinilyticus]OCT12901.1 AraC family transcriptional regulator [Paenibacillus pectinilyticus]